MTMDPVALAASVKALRAALTDYDVVRERYLDALRAKGVVFAESGAGRDERRWLRSELEARGVTVRNGGASLSWGWLSEACEACTGPMGSETFSTTLACHRDCYFCFNHNLEDYEVFSTEGCPWEEGLEARAAEGKRLTTIGLTGGEPLLAFDETIAFLHKAQELFPGVHLRLYTSGDLLDEAGAQALAEAGLREIRFSVKDFDPDPLKERVLTAMEIARRFIPDVMVEMPIIPGTEPEMRALFDRFAAIGIRGINLLEFCFPFHNWDEFARRGFVVRNPPFPIMYDYSYSGGLPIAGSEELALQLMIYALDAQLGIGLHYCSLENKHRSEMRQKNERAAGLHPVFTFDEQDFFLKAAKVFGPVRTVAKTIAADEGFTVCLDDDDEDATLMSLGLKEKLDAAGLPVATSYNVLETEEGASYLMEVGLEL